MKEGKKNNLHEKIFGYNWTYENRKCIDRVNKCVFHSDAFAFDRAHLPHICGHKCQRQKKRKEPKRDEAVRGI